MKTKSLLFPFGAVLAGLFLLGGCDTPQSRIASDPAAFAALTPQQQAMVQAGQVGIGFTAEAVKLALGDPDRVTIRSDASGDTQVWHYVQYEADGVFLYSGYYHRGWRGRGGWWGGPSYPYFLDYPHRSIRDRYTVDLKNNVVISISREEP